MRIATIFCRSSKTIRVARRRPLDRARRLRVERLEDRTQLSTVWGSVSAFPVVPMPPTLHTDAPGAPLAVKLPTIEIAAQDSVVFARLGGIPADSQLDTLIAARVDRSGPPRDVNDLFSANVAGDGNVGSISPPPWFGALAGHGELTGADLVRFIPRDFGHELGFSGRFSPSGLNYDALSPPEQQTDNSPVVPAPAVAASNLSIQVDAILESANAGWMLYVATGGMGDAVFEPTTVRIYHDSSAEDIFAVPIPPLSTAGLDGYMSDLLTGPDALSQTSSDDLQQVAELVPLPGSSLALIATMWTVSSDSPVGLPLPSERFDASDLPISYSLAPAAWARFVAGLDDAFEHTRIDSRPATDFADGAQAVRDQTRHEVRDALDSWPLAPAREWKVQATADASPLATGSAAGDDGAQLVGTGGGHSTPPCASVPEALGGRVGLEAVDFPASEPATPVAAWAISLVSVCASAFIVRRSRLKRWWAHARSEVVRAKNSRSVDL